MAIQSSPTSAAPAEYSAILSCLAGIRLRLWTVRLAERVALALAIAAAVAVFLTAARLLHLRFPWLALANAILPILAATWLWFAAPLISRRFLSPRLRTSGISLLVVASLVFAVSVALYLVDSALLQNSRVFWAGIALPIVALAAPIAAFVWLWKTSSQIPHDFALQRLLRGAAVLAAVLAAATITVLYASINLPPWTFAAATGAAFLLAAAATVRPIKPAAAAIFVDQHVGLKERVSTALELLQTQPPGGTSDLEKAFREPVITSALNACHSVRSAKVGYARMDSRLYPFAATTAIIAAMICLVPPLQLQARPHRAPYLAVVQKGNTLAEKLKELEQDPRLSQDPKAQALLRQFNQIATDMKKGDMSPFEAQDRMSSAMSAMKEQDAQAQAASEMEKAFSKDFSQLGKAGDNLRDATINGNKGDAGANEQKQSAQGDVSRAAGEMGDKLKGMSDQEKKDLADKLNNAADKAAGDPTLQQELKSAAQAAREGNSQKLSQSMADATNRAAEQSAQKVSQEELRQTMEKIAEAESGGLSQGEQQANQNSGQNSSGGEQQSPGNQQQGGGQDSAQNGGDNQQNGQSGSQQGQANSGQQGSGGKNGDAQSASAGPAGSNQQQGGGSTNLHAPSGPGGENEGGPIGKSETYVRIYDENTITSRGPTQRAQGKINALGTPSGTVEIRGQGDKSDPAIKTYQEALPAARQRALDDLQTQQIPPQYKDLIRSYYEK